MNARRTFIDGMKFASHMLCIGTFFFLTVRQRSRGRNELSELSANQFLERKGLGFTWGRLICMLMPPCLQKQKYEDPGAESCTTNTVHM